MSDTGTLTRGEVLRARANDPLWPKRDKATASAKPPAPPRLCEICDTNIDDAHPRAKTCHKEDCKIEMRNRRLRRAREEKKAAAKQATANKSDPQSPAEPGAEPDVEAEHPPLLASLIATSPKPVDDAADRQDSDDGDRLGRIEAAAQRFLEACARERSAQQIRITAERRLTEALSVGQDTDRQRTGRGPDGAR